MIPKDKNNFRFKSGNKIKYAFILKLETIWDIWSASAIHREHAFGFLKDEEF
jgi:hypothetical protein